jgi:glycosyltransferase involved in cell wall biosynthesis
MDAIIVPSHHEPFGIVCLEALASGCILLSSFESGMKEYLTEDVAINCGTSIDTITKAIEYWLNIDDSETRIQKGYDLCKKYSWEKAGTALEGIYKKVLEK